MRFCRLACLAATLSLLICGTAPYMVLGQQAAHGAQSRHATAAKAKPPGYVPGRGSAASNAGGKTAGKTTGKTAGKTAGKTTVAATSSAAAIGTGATATAATLGSAGAAPASPDEAALKLFKPVEQV